MTMFTPHTPGPWTWIKDTDGYHLVTAHSGQLAVLTSALNASMGDWDAPSNSCLFGREGFPSQLVPMTPDHPDARLIAAAPNLLAALKTLLNATDDIEGLDGCSERAIAKAAIAEAEGK